MPAVAGVLALALWACGGGEGAGGEAPPDAEDSEQPAAAAGIPVSEPSGEIDEALAERGEEIFTARGCVACHTVGRGRLVGPDLLGVTGRREFPWFYHMIMNPDSMLRNDPVAKQLLAEYLTPMLYQNVQPDEVPALWEYLREETAEGGAEEGETAEEGPAEAASS